MVKIEESTGNVYADLGLSDADEMLVKAQLAVNIDRIIKRRKLSQKEAAEMMGISQAKVSDMRRGRFRGITPGLGFFFTRVRAGCASLPPSPSFFRVSSHVLRFRPSLFFAFPVPRMDGQLPIRPLPNPKAVGV